VPIRRPDTNCVSLITVVPLCNVSCRVSSFNERAVAACVAAKSDLHISLQSTCADESHPGFKQSAGQGVKLTQRRWSTSFSASV
jgi:hypothetical protein